MAEFAKKEVIYEKEESALFLEISRAGSMSWGLYAQRCAMLRISERRHLDLGVIKFAEKHMEPREHEGRGCVSEPEIAADSLVCLTDHGKEIVAAINWLNDGLRPDSETSISLKPRLRRFKPLKVPPQRVMFPPVD